MIENTIEYVLIWLINDIIVYLPPIIIIGITWLILSKYKPHVIAKPAAKAETVPVIPFFIAMYALVSLANILNHQIADFFTRNFGTGELPDVFESVMPKSGAEWIIMLCFVGIIAPIAEEFIFRHLLLRPLRKLGNVPAIVITALLFGIFHWNFTQFLYAAVAGIILGIAAVKANSPKPAIIIHMLNNSFDIVKSFFYEKAEETGFTAGETILDRSVTLLLLGGIITAVILIVTGNFKVDSGKSRGGS